jgi:hypothetical protein
MKKSTNKQFYPFAVSATAGGYNIKIGFHAAAQVSAWHFAAACAACNNSKEN